MSGSAAAWKGKARATESDIMRSDEQERRDALDAIASSSYAGAASASSAQFRAQAQSDRLRAPATAPMSAPPERPQAQQQQQRRPQAWVHFAAGGLGGMCGAIVTSPLDVVKTRLQSDMYQEQQAARRAAAATSKAGAGGSGAARTGALRTARTLAYHFVETAQLLREISVREGPRALFKGLGPTLVGVIPARSINFYTYGNGKQLLARHFGKDGKESPLIHLSAAACAGIVTATATNPIWVVKTRLQLENQSEAKKSAERRKASVRPAAAQASAASAFASPSRHASSVTAPLSFSARPAPARPSTSSVAMALQIVRNEGVRGLYKGMSASYLGVAEGTIQWALYEQLKAWPSAQTKAKEGQRKTSLSSTVSAAGTAKLIASLITYPHEVLRTRLRQEAPPGQPRKYTGIAQTIKLIAREEGVAALYGGLSAHLLRVVPNAAVMFSIYEVFLHFAPAQSS